MDSDKSKKSHAKTRLAGDDDSNVVYCEHCEVLELNLGAFTLRLNPESFDALSSVLNHARARLQKYGGQKGSVQPAGNKIVH